MPVQNISAAVDSIGGTPRPLPVKGYPERRRDQGSDSRPKPKKPDDQTTREDRDNPERLGFAGIASYPRGVLGRLVYPLWPHRSGPPVQPTRNP